MNIIKTKLNDCLIIEPKVFGDNRGFFLETFQAKRYRDLAQITFSFVQDNHSRSSRGVLRGLHFQVKKPQGKLVSCSYGNVFDVAVDIDIKSKTFGKYVGVELSAENHMQLFIPPGYAHGFCVLSEYAHFSYKCTDFYYPEDESGLIWNDPNVNIKWPISNPVLSTKDKGNLLLSELCCT